VDCFITFQKGKNWAQPGKAFQSIDTEKRRFHSKAFLMPIFSFFGPILIFSSLQKMWQSRPRHNFKLESGETKASNIKYHFFHFICLCCIYIFMLWKLRKMVYPQYFLQKYYFRNLFLKASLHVRFQCAFTH